jgi:hypothetical protein
VRLRLLGVAVAALAAAGCGKVATGRDDATLWITRDRGAHVLLVRHVPSGVTAMQALERAAKVKTSYGGRFVQAVNGSEGSRTASRDWFYYVNGIEADRSAVEYRLHQGDVEWWDYHSWSAGRDVPVVVGAFPEPLLHGYAGKTHPTTMRVDHVRWTRNVSRLARLVRARKTAPPPRNEVVVVPGGEFRATIDRRTLAVRFTIGIRAVRRLAANPAAARFRYEGLP